MSDRTRLDYGRQAECWTEAQEPVVSFVCDSGQIVGFPFFHLHVAQILGEVLTLQWPGAVIEIRGPKVLDFYRVFAKGKGTWIKADGVDIVTVTLHTRES